MPYLTKKLSKTREAWLPCHLVQIIFTIHRNCKLFSFGEHSLQNSEIISDSELRHHSWQGSGNPLGCLGLKLSWLYARQDELYLFCPQRLNFHQELNGPFCEQRRSFQGRQQVLLSPLWLEPTSWQENEKTKKKKRRDK